MMLTARDEEADRVAGLEVGADDYIGKPFSPRELVARMKAVLRRAEPAPRSRACSTLGDIVARAAARARCSVGGAASSCGEGVRPARYLMENRGVVLSRDALLDRVWGYDYPGGTRTVDVHVAQLRRKLGRPELIRTVRGAGYKAVQPLRGDARRSLRRASVSLVVAIVDRRARSRLTLVARRRARAALGREPTRSTRLGAPGRR